MYITEAHQKVKDAQTEHFEGETYVSMVVKPIQHPYTEAIQGGREGGRGRGRGRERERGEGGREGERDRQTHGKCVNKSEMTKFGQRGPLDMQYVP